MNTLLPSTILCTPTVYLRQYHKSFLTVVTQAHINLHRLLCLSYPNSEGSQRKHVSTFTIYSFPLVLTETGRNMYAGHGRLVRQWDRLTLIVIYKSTPLSGHCFHDDRAESVMIVD